MQRKFATLHGTTTCINFVYAREDGKYAICLFAYYTMPCWHIDTAGGDRVETHVSRIICFIVRIKNAVALLALCV